MKISEILTMENKNTNSVFLHKEGLFYRAYELSAYLFATQIHQYSITKKYVKIIDREIVYIGFPASYLQTILLKVKDNEVTKSEKLVEIKDFVLQGNYTEWKASISIATKEVLPIAAQDIGTGSYQFKNVIEKIRNYQVATKSPVDAQQFLIEIQHEINGPIC